MSTAESYYVITPKGGQPDIFAGPSGYPLGEDKHGWVIHRAATKAEYDRMAYEKAMARLRGEPTPAFTGSLVA